MLGRWLGVVSRAVVGGLTDCRDEEEKIEGGALEKMGEYEQKEEEEEDLDVGDWNVVQNNGMCFHYVIHYCVRIFGGCLRSDCP